jgi:chromosome segregation ATPase
MNPTQKQILQKFATQKVDLSSLKQIKNAISNLKNQENDADKIATKFEAKIREASDAYDLVLKERNAIYNWVMREAPARISDFDKAAKELGISSDSVSEIKQLKKLILQGREIIKVLDEYKRPKF